MISVIRRRSSARNRVNSPVEPFGIEAVHAAGDQPIDITPEFRLVDFARIILRNQVGCEDTPQPFPLCHSQTVAFAAITELSASNLQSQVVPYYTTQTAQVSPLVAIELVEPATQTGICNRSIG